MQSIAVKRKPSRGGSPPRTLRKAPPARPPARFVVRIGLSAQTGAEPRTRPCRAEFGANSE
eukprot:15485362-Alexandrium_andersonii.AAC.1